MERPSQNWFILVELIQPSESSSPLTYAFPGQLPHGLALLNSQQWWTQSKVGRWDGPGSDSKCLSAEPMCISWKSTVGVVILTTVVQKFGNKSTFVILDFGPAQISCDQYLNDKY